MMILCSAFDDSSEAPERSSLTKASGAVLSVCIRSAVFGADGGSFCRFSGIGGADIARLAIPVDVGITGVDGLLVSSSL